MEGVAHNDNDDKTGLRGYVQFDKCTHTDTERDTPGKEV